MSYTTCQQLSDLQNCRKGSLPDSGTSTRINSTESGTSGIYLPHISSRSLGCSSAESSSFDEADNRRDQLRKRQNQSRRSYDDSLRSEYGNTNSTKFPEVPPVSRHKSHSVNSLCSNSYRSRKTYLRAEMCRSPSCPSLCSEYEEPGLVEDGDLNASIHPVHTRKSIGAHALRLPDLYDTTQVPETRRSVNYNGTTKSSKIDKEIQQLSRRRQREEEERRDRLRKEHRQQKLDRQKTQPVALLLPIRDTSRANRAKQTSQSVTHSQRRSGSSIHSTYSVKSDSGISSCLRHSDASEVASNRAEESEWSGWEDGEQDPDDEDEEHDEEEEYEDAGDAGYEEEDEYEDEPYYSAQGSREEGYEDTDQVGLDRGEEKRGSAADHNAYTATTAGYYCKGPRHRRYKVAQSQNAQDYQPKTEMDSQKKCQEWLQGRKKKAQRDKST